MIVTFHARGTGGGKGPTQYLLGRDGQREGATLLRGDPEQVAALALFFQFTATGRALRAVADDHQAAQSIGIPLNRIWVIVWCVAGVVALVAGMIWDRFKLVAYDIPRGNLAAYYPETNPLVPLSAVAEAAGTPTSKSIPVILEPHVQAAPLAEARGAAA